MLTNDKSQNTEEYFQRQIQIWFGCLFLSPCILLTINDYDTTIKYNKVRLTNNKSVAPQYYWLVGMINKMFIRHNVVQQDNDF